MNSAGLDATNPAPYKYIEKRGDSVQFSSEVGVLFTNPPPTPPPLCHAAIAMASLGTAQQVTQTAAQAIRVKDGERLAETLRLDMGNTSLMTQLKSDSVQLEHLCGTALEEPYDEMLLEHFLFLRAVGAGNHVDAYTHQERALICFQMVFEKDSSWALPALHALDLELRRAAQRADQQLGARGEKRCKLEEAARVLQKSFQYTVTDRSPIAESKKWGTLHVINDLFKIYFELNNLRLCQNLIRAVEGPGFPKALDGQTIEGRHFAVAQLVTFKYFVGRLSMLNSQFGKAEVELTFAFTHCPATATQNKRLILRYLVPVQMVLGRFASPALLRKYRLPYFVPLCRAVHRGDLKGFEQELEKNQTLFIQHGSYLLVERAKIITYRNFFKRVVEMQKVQSNKIDLKMFRRCLAAIGIDMDTDEIECIVANLIYSGYIKGYIAHQHGKVVLSKENAFPSLADVAGGR